MRWAPRSLQKAGLFVAGLAKMDVGLCCEECLSLTFVQGLVSLLALQVYPWVQFCGHLGAGIPTPHHHHHHVPNLPSGFLAEPFGNHRSTLRDSWSFLVYSHKFCRSQVVCCYRQYLKGFLAHCPMPHSGSGCLLFWWLCCCRVARYEIHVVQLIRKVVL